MSSNLKIIIRQYKQILIEDGMVEYDELMDMLRMDEEICFICKNNEETLSKVCKIILKQAEGSKRINLERTHIDKVLEERMKLYEQGLSDVMIAEKQGVCLTTIYYWRQVRNLDPNPTESERVNEIRMRLYEQGLTDSEIAKITNTTYNAVGAWRRRNHLPINERTGDKNDRRPEKVS
jgi:DNA-binding transcriptional regulator YiaG